MSTALTYLYYIYDKLIKFIFDDLDIGGSVTIGWIIIVIGLFGIIIKSILNLPRNVNLKKINKKGNKNNE